MVSKALKEMTTTFYIFDMNILVGDGGTQLPHLWMKIARDNAEGAISTVLFGEADPVRNLVDTSGSKEFRSVYTLTLIDDGFDRLSDKKKTYLVPNKVSIFEEAEIVVQENRDSQVLTINLTHQTPEDVAWLLYCWVEDRLSAH
ncbi:hypothetical protein ACNA6I_23335 (plasmid) [Rossellomorea sp. FS2]|uniref:hypothetical protein n=1 Tax=Rossellomorea sp. FS2 TaxID=3391447 RepID=UPI003A4D367C